MMQQPTSGQWDNSPPDRKGTGMEGVVPSDTRTPLFRANNDARYQRRAIIQTIQDCTGRPLVCYVSGIRCGIDRDDFIPFGDLLHNVPRGRRMELLLHTPGGSGDAAEKLIRMVRGKAEEANIHIVVPDFAKSAGTLMVLGADVVVMSDMSELGPIDPQMRFADTTGHLRWQSVQSYLDAYEEYKKTLTEDPSNVPAQIMLNRLDPLIVKQCESVRDRARQSAESQLREGMFRKDTDRNWTKTAAGLLDTRQWLSHSQMISWRDAMHPDIGLEVEYLNPESDLWQHYWRLYCLQRLAIGEHQKLYESEYASLVIDAAVE